MGCDGPCVSRSLPALCQRQVMDIVLYCIQYSSAGVRGSGGSSAESRNEMSSLELSRKLRVRLDAPAINLTDYHFIK